jgi:hypothetical protein
MLMVVGTVPDETFPLLCGSLSHAGGSFSLDGKEIDIERGTGALLAAALEACRVFDPDFTIRACLAGDIGLGKGSREIYAFLEENLSDLAPSVVAFHYLQPDIDWHNRVLFALQAMQTPPFLVADAGYMYAAKASGQAAAYDLFTPDVGELAFLADEEAPHPFYTRGFILHQNDRVKELAIRAWEHKNASRYLLVKGRQDYCFQGKELLGSVQSPDIPNLEPIGGTGDTITGMAAALVAVGLDVAQAALTAAKANRLAGRTAKPNPATSIAEIIPYISKAVESALNT